jgi:hypothetical protein
LNARRGFYSFKINLTGYTGRWNFILPDPPIPAAGIPRPGAARRVYGYRVYGYRVYGDGKEKEERRELWRD